MSAVAVSREARVRAPHVDVRASRSRWATGDSWPTTAECVPSVLAIPSTPRRWGTSKTPTPPPRGRLRSPPPGHPTHSLRGRGGPPRPILLASRQSAHSHQNQKPPRPAETLPQRGARSSLSHEHKQGLAEGECTTACRCCGYQSLSVVPGGPAGHTQCCDQERATPSRAGSVLLAQPRTPLANSVPRSVSPLHCLSRGWSAPATISVAPSLVFAKHRTCSAFAMLSTIGE
jgi:hypothetical protein